MGKERSDDWLKVMLLLPCLFVALKATDFVGPPMRWTLARCGTWRCG